MRYQLRISGIHFEHIQKHLFPGDNKEAIAVALCGFHLGSNETILMMHEVHLIPYEDCERNANYVHWKTDSIVDVLEKGGNEQFSFLKIHSHPSGYENFSELDDQSDNKLFPSVLGWIDGEQPHCSCVMLPNGKIFGRVFTVDRTVKIIDSVSICGNRINTWRTKNSIIDEEATLRNRQTLGLYTTKLLKSMKIGVVGASGTGSPTIEQLARLGVGEIVIIDPDKVEKKNLNRIINTRYEHAEKGSYKTDVLAEAIEGFGFGTIVHPFKENLFDSRSAIKELITCDVIFGCVDSIDGRHLLNQISTFYLIPYFDLGVKLEADGTGGISQINGAVHYIQPGRSSLLSRGVYNTRGLEAASLMRQDPEEYKRRSREKYIVNLPVESPAVISINMQISSFAVNEFLDRVHSFKGTDPMDRAINWISITEGLIFSEPDGDPDHFLMRKIGRGDTSPFLEMPDL